MKFGLRKPSLKKSLSARTKGRATRAVKKALIPGYGKKGTGFLKNPKKAAYNKVYRKTTFGLSDLFKGSKKSAKASPSPGGPAPQPAGPAPGRPNRPKKPFTKRWYVWAIVIVVAIGAIGSLGQSQTAYPAAHPAATAVSSLADAKDIDAAQNPGTSSALSSAEAVQTDTGQEGTSGPSAQDTSTPSSGDPAAALPPAGTQTTETGDPTPQTAEPEPEPDPEPAPEPAPEPEPDPGPSEITVYITDTGSKYHRAGCRYLKDSQHEISLSSAKSNGYEPCKVCKPPTG